MAVSEAQPLKSSFLLKQIQKQHHFASQKSSTSAKQPQKGGKIGPRPCSKSHPSRGVEQDLEILEQIVPLDYRGRTEYKPMSPEEQPVLEGFSKLMSNAAKSLFALDLYALHKSAQREQNKGDTIKT